MDESCETCRWHYQEEVDRGWVCVNPESEYAAEWTEMHDYCDEWERRE